MHPHHGRHRRCAQAAGRPLRHHGGEHDDAALTRGRKFSGKELQLMFLALLEDAPCHGYELIRAIEQRSRGVYAPSPGVVYPALTYLEETGLVTAEEIGKRKRYHLAPDGAARLQAARDDATLLLKGLLHMGLKMEAMRRAVSGESADDGEAGWLPEFVNARRGLKRALLLKSDADHAEQRRIAHILQQALNAIEQGDPDA